MDRVQSAKVSPPTHLSPQSPVHVIRSVHRPVVERHAVDCAFFWVRRDQAVKAPHFKNAKGVVRNAMQAAQTSLCEDAVNMHRFR